MSAWRGLLPMRSAFSKVGRLLFRYHSMMSDCPKMQALASGVSPPMVWGSTLEPALTRSSKISMLPTAAA